MDTEVDVSIRADLARDGRTACRADLALIDHNRVAEAAVTDPGLGDQLDAPGPTETARLLGSNSATQPIRLVPNASAATVRFCM